MGLGQGRQTREGEKKRVINRVELQNAGMDHGLLAAKTRTTDDGRRMYIFVRRYINTVISKKFLLVYSFILYAPGV